MKPYQVGVTLDLADFPEGRHAVPLSEKDVSLPTGVKVSRIFPPVIEIHLEKVLRRTLPVLPNVSLPPGLPERPFRVEADPPVALVEATAADIARIRAVETEPVYPDRNTGSYTTDASLEAPGGHAKILEPRTVRVRVTFRERDRR
jgi:YbbR domain-containing protein